MISSTPENICFEDREREVTKKEKTAEKHLNEVVISAHFFFIDFGVLPFKTCKFLMQLKNLLLTKDKEIESLMKQREENLKVAEKVIQESESYEKKHSKQVFN